MPILLILILIVGAYFILTAFPKTPPPPTRAADPQAKTLPAERTPTGRLVTIADLRVPGETGSLVVGVALLVLVVMLLLRATFGAIFLLMGLALVWIRVRQGQMVGQAVKVTEHQLPDVYAVACQAADRLCMPTPDVFVTQHPIINAYALGFVGRQSVVLHSATVEAMEPNELCSILGHEFTHIKCRHTRWLVLTNLKGSIRLPIISEVVGFVLLQLGAQSRIYQRSRRADRVSRSASSNFCFGQSCSGERTVQTAQYRCLLEPERNAEC